MPLSSHWVLALAQLLYYAPSALPLTYILYRHRRTGLSAWIFLSAFVILQCVGSGMLVSAGPHSTPSWIALLLVQVGVSPLVLGLAGALHEYARLTGLIADRRTKRLGVMVDIAFHLAVVGAIAIYAVGASESFKGAPPANAESLYKAGVVLLLVLFAALVATFIAVALKTREARIAQSLFWSIGISLLLLNIRIVYSTVAAFDRNDPRLHPVTGKIVYQIVLVFLPGALVVAAMVVGGTMSIHVDAPSFGASSPAAIPLYSSHQDSGDTRGGYRR